MHFIPMKILLYIWLLNRALCLFFGAYGDDIESHNKKDIPFVLARYAKPSASKYAINYDIKFPAQKQNGNHILTYDDIFYVPDEEALKLYALVKWLYRRTDSYSKAEEKKIRTIIEEKKYIPAVAFLGILDDSVDVNRENLDEYLKIFDNEKKTSLYHMAYIFYGMKCFTMPQGKEKLLWAMEKQKGEKSYHYLRTVYATLQLMELLKDVDWAGDDFYSIASVLEEHANEILENYNNALNGFSVKEIGFLYEGFFYKAFTDYSTLANTVLFAYYSSISFENLLSRNYEDSYIFAKKAREILNPYTKNGIEYVIRNLMGSEYDYFDILKNKLNAVENYFNSLYNQDL